MRRRFRAATACFGAPPVGGPAVHAFSPVYAEVPVLAGAAADDGCGFSPDLRAELVALGAGIETSVDVVESAAAPGILQYAVQHPIDLIVIGTHGNSGFRHLILGSVTEKVLRTAPCPVLTIRHTQHDFIRPDGLVAVRERVGARA